MFTLYLTAGLKISTPDSQIAKWGFPSSNLCDKQTISSQQCLVPNIVRWSQVGFYQKKWLEKVSLHKVHQYVQNYRELITLYLHAAGASLPTLLRCCVAESTVGYSQNQGRFLGAEDRNMFVQCRDVFDACHFEIPKKTSQEIINRLSIFVSGTGSKSIFPFWTLENPQLTGKRRFHKLCCSTSEGYRDKDQIDSGIPKILAIDITQETRMLKPASDIPFGFWMYFP